MRMKKINFKQPKYVFPLIVFLPMVFLGYEVANLFGGNSTKAHTVATDNINMTLPEARNEEMGDKMAEMDKHFGEDDAYTAIGALGDEKEKKDSTGSGYSGEELKDIDAENAERMKRQKEVDDLEQSLAQSRRHINRYGYDDGGHVSSREQDMDDYAKEIEDIQQRSRRRQKALEQGLGISGNEENNSRDETATNKRKDKTSSKMEGKPEIVKKLEETNGDKFNTITNETAVDALLIRAMIDKTTHAHEGTRLRFKLLDDVSIKNVKLKRGSYLYGLVTGFVGQRVQASITSILIENKFIRVNLSVFDNDGMEGFYVPQSAFRDMIKDAGSQVMQNNISLDSGSGSELSGEAVALQALQNAYQSASSAVSANIRKNKARIKYNTIVYLINKEASE
jgi:conjugative transposon TraM protein